MYKYFVVSASLLAAAPSESLAKKDYQTCLNKAIKHAGKLLKHKHLASSTRFCIRQGKYTAENLVAQYKTLIKPQIKEQKALVKSCKANKACLGVEDFIVPVSAQYRVNCDRPRVKFSHACEIQLKVKGVQKTNVVSRGHIITPGDKAPPFKTDRIRRPPKG